MSVTAPTECPYGHPNPPGWQLCGECGARIEAVEDTPGTPVTRRWNRPAAMAAVLTLAAAALIGVFVLVAHQPSGTTPPTDDTAAVATWWSTAQQPFLDVKQAVDDTQTALDALDPQGVATACQDMHDAIVALQAELPAPDRAIDAELHAAIEDVHSAAHMCLAAEAGSTNSYQGEFAVALEQADQQLQAARRLINKSQSGI
ncbi:hypothetical protein BH09ACT7_BH09ACT7_20780 [soil metagenome]